ncbi:DUF2254 domain-containing protein [Actinomadura craniellae]|uniref:DUF2254 domain-containing protein n=1 Tax=Actinomadura craniellae TaxID=2231787 RepID=A0A365H5V9_9ACTN|nr:DUF2254 domain-containing protein [Actinomadura craniellae]RAY13623.1 DUF2254 domain-containing protein [Actinomadura craniellae]
MRPFTPRRPQAERSRGPLWLWPAIGSLVALGCGLLTVRVSLFPSHPLAWLRWPGDTNAAKSLLEALASSVITVTGLAFSLTVVTLQLASQQFSPRLLREFTRDRVIKAVLCVLVSTFVYTITVLRYLEAGRPVPDLALFIASLLGLAELAAVLALITHVARLLRVDTMMRMVHDETAHAIRTLRPAYDDPPSRPADGTRSGGRSVPAGSSGFVRIIDVGPLLRAARTTDALIGVGVHPGDHVVRGTPVASVWSRADRPLDLPAIEAAVQESIRLGYERAAEQDIAYGFRQLTDIAVKALSPGINDPVTAAHSIGHTADLLVRLTGRWLGGAVYEDGAGRVELPDRGLAYYLELACGQVRRYGRREPTVLIALLRMLRDVAVAARDDEQRAQIARQTDLVVAEVPSSLGSHDTEQVGDMAERVRQALHGEVRRAYRDPDGGTRSL